MPGFNSKSPGVYIEEIPGGIRTIKGVSTSTTAFVGRALKGPPEKPVLIHNFVDFERTFGGLWEKSTMSFAVQQYFLNGGSEALIVCVKGSMPDTSPDSGDEGDIRDEDLVPASPDTRKGIYALENAEIFNILCLPPLSSEKDLTPDTIARAASYCEKRRAMLLIDPPAEAKDPDLIKEFLRDKLQVSLKSSGKKNAALFFPRIRMANSLKKNLLEDFAPCGAIAGVFARTDRSSGVWKAPAGIGAILYGVSELSYTLNDSENGELNRPGVNCLRTFPARGSVVWGARTLEGADTVTSEWKYIPVRRLALYIEESLFKGTEWVGFEPNSEPLWARIRLNIEAFMNNLFRQGAFPGKTPQEAYFVKCDLETTTPDEVSKGIVNIIVGFAPLRPAEFVILRIQQRAGEIQP